jgi:nucleoside-diphosphate-sugar epimerase
LPETFTVLGASGFVGSHLARHLRARGHEVFAPARGTALPEARRLGHVIYAVGLTGDFRRRPFDTMEAHVGVLAETLRSIQFDSFLYLSSTRLYGGARHGGEDAVFQVDPATPGDLYNLSKLAGEALCHACERPRVRVARLSNVYAPAIREDTDAAAGFLPSVIADALRGELSLATDLGSSKDYIRVDDVCRALERIALSGTQRCYNVAAGRNTTNREIADSLRGITGCRVIVEPGAPLTVFPKVDTSRLAARFAAAGESWAPASLIDDLPRIMASAGSRTAA